MFSKMVSSLTSESQISRFPHDLQFPPASLCFCQMLTSAKREVKFTTRKLPRSLFKNSPLNNMMKIGKSEILSFPFLLVPCSNFPRDEICQTNSQVPPGGLSDWSSSLSSCISDVPSVRVTMEVAICLFKNLPGKFQRISPGNLQILLVPQKLISI